MRPTLQRTPTGDFDDKDEGRHGRRASQALAILDEVGADNAFVQYDIYHEQRMEADAPVPGGEVGVKNATLSIMAGGPQPSSDRIWPFFELIGKSITRVRGNATARRRRSRTRSSSH